MTLGEIRRDAVRALAGADGGRPSPTPALDADVLIADALGRERSWVLAHRTDEVGAEPAEEIARRIARRLTGLPVAYITGRKEFFGNDFLVTPAVLIPKPDTELLVELAAAAAEASASERAAICDMCAGSGCVGISVARAVRRPLSLTLADLSAEALDVARENARRLLVGAEVEFVLGDLFGRISGTFDVIATNPPYIPSDEARALLEDGRGEPILALDGLSDDGLGIVRRLVPQAFAHLNAGGTLLMETGEYNAAAAAAEMARAGFSAVRTELDMTGRPRVTVGRKTA